MFIFISITELFLLRRVKLKKNFNTDLLLVVCLLLIFLFVDCSATTEVLRPRGVALSKKVLYVAEKDFVCFDGSNTVPFSFVNDDYCDCEDGSDEPGTSACSNSLFYCVNSGHVSSNIPSSMVDDNICDCCDGSDENNSFTNCINTCTELGRKAAEERQRKQELFEQGFALWKEYSVEGQKLKEKKKSELQNLKQLEAEEEKNKNEKEVMKNEAEEKEKAALAVYTSAKEEKRKMQEEIDILQHQEKEKENAEAAFQDLDLDKNGILTYQELQKFEKFDSNNDGFVSEDEAKFYLHMKDAMDFDEFATVGWMIMKPVYLSDKHPAIGTETEASLEDEERKAPTEVGDETDSSNDDTLDDLLGDEELDKIDVPSTKEDDEAVQPQEQEYDEETNYLVNAANEARKQYQEACTKLEKVRETIKNLESFIDADFGIADEFAVLKGQCFDFEDREYTYRFCPFDKASQIAKSGGFDVNLGRWGHWDGPEENKYLQMKYDNGQTCWNGPARSATVLLQCGTENRLLSSSEPNRCEYRFEFSTPALCALNETSFKHHIHEEL